MTKMELSGLPPAKDIRALVVPAAGNADAAEYDLSPYVPAVAQLARQAAARGEKGMVIKFEVADYADEASCGKAIARMGEVLESRGYTCCVSYDTYALALRKERVETSVMRNPAIIAMTVIW